MAKKKTNKKIEKPKAWTYRLMKRRAESNLSPHNEDIKNAKEDIIVTPSNKFLQDSEPSVKHSKSKAKQISQSKKASNARSKKHKGRKTGKDSNKGDVNNISVLALKTDHLKLDDLTPFSHSKEDQEVKSNGKESIGINDSKFPSTSLVSKSTEEVHSKETTQNTKPINSQFTLIETKGDDIKRMSIKVKESVVSQYNSNNSDIDVPSVDEDAFTPDSSVSYITSKFKEVLSEKSLKFSSSPSSHFQDDDMFLAYYNEVQSQKQPETQPFSPNETIEIIREQDSLSTFSNNLQHQDDNVENQIEELSFVVLPKGDQHSFSNDFDLLFQELSGINDKLDDILIGKDQNSSLLENDSKNYAQKEKILPKDVIKELEEESGYVLENKNDEIILPEAYDSLNVPNDSFENNHNTNEHFSNEVEEPSLFEIKPKQKVTKKKGRKSTKYIQNTEKANKTVKKDLDQNDITKVTSFDSRGATNNVISPIIANRENSGITIVKESPMTNIKKKNSNIIVLVPTRRYLIRLKKAKEAESVKSNISVNNSSNVVNEVINDKVNVNRHLRNEIDELLLHEDINYESLQLQETINNNEDVVINKIQNDVVNELPSKEIVNLPLPEEKIHTKGNKEMGRKSAKSKKKRGKKVIKKVDKVILLSSNPQEIIDNAINTVSDQPQEFINEKSNATNPILSESQESINDNTKLVNSISSHNQEIVKNKDIQTKAIREGKDINLNSKLNTGENVVFETIENIINVNKQLEKETEEMPSLGGVNHVSLQPQEVNKAIETLEDNNLEINTITYEQPIKEIVSSSLLEKKFQLKEGKRRERNLAKGHKKIEVQNKRDRKASSKVENFDRVKSTSQKNTDSNFKHTSPQLQKPANENLDLADLILSKSRESINKDPSFANRTLSQSQKATVNKSNVHVSPQLQKAINYNTSILNEILSQPLDIAKNKAGIVNPVLSTSRDSIEFITNPEDLPEEISNTNNNNNVLIDLNIKKDKAELIVAKNKVDHLINFETSKEKVNISLNNPNSLINVNKSTVNDSTHESSSNKARIKPQIQSRGVRFIDILDPYTKMMSLYDYMTKMIKNDEERKDYEQLLKDMDEI